MPYSIRDTPGCRTGIGRACLARGPSVRSSSTPTCASADETSADDARRRLREQGIVAVEPDARIGVMLAPGERVVAVRRAVSIERRKDTRDPEAGLLGDLYVTTSRLVYLGSVPVEVPLLEIREAVAAAGALRLVVGDGRGVEIRTGDPLRAPRRDRGRPGGRQDDRGRVGHRPGDGRRHGSADTGGR